MIRESESPVEDAFAADEPLNLSTYWFLLVGFCWPRRFGLR